MRIAFLLLPLLIASAARADSVSPPASSGAVEEAVVVIDVKGLRAPPLPVADASRARAHEEARAVIGQRCALCHGASGRSNGVMSVTLQPRPRDFSEPAWQRSRTDEQLKKVILGGGVAIGKSAVMPANPDLKSKPDVVTEMVRLIRAFERRGVVRAQLVGANGRAWVHAEGAPDMTGTSAVVRLEGTPGTYTVRGYFDVDEDAQRDAAEPAFERADVVVTNAPVHIEVDLSSAARRP